MNIFKSIFTQIKTTISGRVQRLVSTIATMRLLYKIRNIVEIQGFHEANKYLKDGYVLMDINTTPRGFTYLLGTVDSTKVAQEHRL